MSSDTHKYIQQNKEVYNHIAKQFSETRAWLWDDLKPLAAFVHAGDEVLDVGCGNGRLFQLFQGQSINYTGIDQSEALVALAQQKFPDANFVVGEMTKLPFADVRFQVVFCIAALHHLPNESTRLAALAEMKRVIAPGQSMVFTNWNLLGDWGRKKLEKQEIKKISDTDFMVPWKNSAGETIGERYYHAFPLEELAALFTAAGLVIQDQYYTKRGEKSNREQGENIVSIVRAP